jgi:hypothetical protein
MPCSQIVVGAGSVEELDGSLRQLDIILHAGDGGTSIQDCDKQSKVDGAKDTNKSHVGLAVVGGGAILHGHEDGGISNGGGVVEQCTGRVMN